MIDNAVCLLNVWMMCLSTEASTGPVYFKATSWENVFDMKATNDFKYRNWISACLSPFEAAKWGNVRWKMSSLCKWLHWHSQETNWRILHFKTARPAPFNAKGDPCSSHMDADVVQTSRGHTYYVAAQAHHMECLWIINACKHIFVYACEHCLWDKQSAEKRNRHAANVSMEKMLLLTHLDTYSNLAGGFRWSGV